MSTGPLVAALGDRRKIVGGSPFLGRAFNTEIILTGLECFERDHLVAHKIIPNGLKIIGPDFQRDVRAPIVFCPLVDDVAAGLEGFDFIGTAAKRWF